MKIIIKRKEPIRLYNYPREVTVHPESKTVQTYNADGTLLEVFKLVSKELAWEEDNEYDQSEIVVILNVE